jgi:hypothetical protein
VTESIEQWLGRLYFVQQPVASLSGTWIPDLLSQWNSTIYQLTVNVRVNSSLESGPKLRMLIQRMCPSTQVNGFTFQDKRLDGRYDWLPYVFLTFQSSSFSTCAH